VALLGICLDNLFRTNAINQSKLVYSKFIKIVFI